MLKQEKEYLDFIIAHGVGRNDKVASSPKSYISYLKSVSKLIGEDITPGLLSCEKDVLRISANLHGRKAPRTILNYASAMRQYVAMVSHQKYD